MASLPTPPFSSEHEQGMTKPAVKPSVLENARKEQSPTHRLFVPLPPGRPSTRGASRAVRPEDDPFLTAYLVCTSDRGSGDGGKRRTTGAREGRRRFAWAGLGLGALSCKRDDGAVRPTSRHVAAAAPTPAVGSRGDASQCLGRHSPQAKLSSGATASAKRTTAVATASHEAESTPLWQLERGVRALGVRDQESGGSDAQASRCSRRGTSEVFLGSSAGVSAASAARRRLEEESVAVVLETEDPLGEFRRSMAEMVVENGITSGAELRELLQRFLSLNSPRHHHLILLAFADVGEELFGDGQPVFRADISSKLKALRHKLRE